MKVRQHRQARGLAAGSAGTVPASPALSVAPVTLIVSLVLATALGPLAMSSFIPAIPYIQDDFAVSTTTAQLTLTLSMLAMAVASLVYGGLADRYGRKPVLIGGVLLAVLLAVRLPETRPPQRTPLPTEAQFPAAHYTALLARFPYVRYTLYGAMMQGIFMAFIGGAPYVATEVFRLSAAAYGWHFMVAPIGYLIGSLIAGRFGHRFSREPLLTAGAAIAVVVCVAALWTAGQPWFGPWSFFLPMCVLSGVIGVVFPSAQVGLLIAGGDQSGAASGLFSFVQLAVGALLAQIVGTLLDFGPTGVNAVMTAAAVIALIAMVVRPRSASTA